MTLEETIKYHKEMAEEFRRESERVRDLGEYISSPKQPYNEPVKCYLDCAKEHEQIAEWLTDLLELRLRSQKCTQSTKIALYSKLLNIEESKKEGGAEE